MNFSRFLPLVLVVFALPQPLAGSTLSCRLLLQAYACEPKILTQTVPDTCAPIGLANAVRASVRAMGISPSNFADSNIETIRKGMAGRQLVPQIARAAREMYLPFSSLEAKIEVFSTNAADVRNAGQRQGFLLKTVTQADLLAADPGFDISYSILSLSMHGPSGFVGNHTALFFGFDDDTNGYFAEPRSGQQTFLGQLTPTLFNLATYSAQLEVLQVEPLKPPPVFLRPVRSDSAIILKGVRVQLRHKNPI